MMRAMWTAGSGMMAQQFNVDVISNNLSNVNTTSYKKQKVEFKDLLYETIQRAYFFEQTGRPTNLQVGHGAVPVATTRSFEMGSLEKTDEKLNFAIDGEAFFMVRGPREEIVYTRDGSFRLAMTEDGKMISTADGYPVLDEFGSEIFLDDIDLAAINVSEDGEITYTDEDGTSIPLGYRIGLVKFDNREGLENVGRNFYAMTSASGYHIPDTLVGRPSLLRQGYLESSNVQVVEEMVKLIAAQRAYELSSKAVQTSDEMIGLANNLKR